MSSSPPRPTVAPAPAGFTTLLLTSKERFERVEGISGCARGLLALRHLNPVLLVTKSSPAVAGVSETSDAGLILPASMFYP